MDKLEPYTKSPPISDLQQTLQSTMPAPISERARVQRLSRPYLIAIKCDTDVKTSTIEHRFTASIGVTLIVGNETSQEVLLERADDAMHRPKRLS